MKLVNADKLVEFIENNKEVEYDNFGKKVSCEINDDDLLSFISTNSIDIDYNATLNTSSEMIKGYCKDCKWIYTPECRMYEVQVTQNYKEIGSQYCSEFESKVTKPDVKCKGSDKCRVCGEFINCEIGRAYINSKPDVKTTDKSCLTCSTIEMDKDTEPCKHCWKTKDLCCWTPKADKVEGEK